MVDQITQIKIGRLSVNTAYQAENGGEGEESKGA